MGTKCTPFRQGAFVPSGMVHYVSMTDTPITPTASRAARGILCWNLGELARHAHVSKTIAHRLESGGSISEEQAAKLIAAFAAAGVQILPPPADGARRVPSET